jgi:hypothetical protein
MNCVSVNLTRLLKLLSLILLVTGLTAAQGVRPAGAKRPAGVPEDYVITPFGYFHPSCVKQLGNGDVLLQDERAIQHVDGSRDATSACGYPHFSAAGQVLDEDAAAFKTPAISHAWVEDSSVTTTSSYGELTANWTVPPAPTSDDGQTVFFFPGMEDYKDVVTIIQPVLGWNSDFSAAWGIASWNCCTTGTVYESTPVSVKSGDEIHGTMKSSCAGGSLSCSTWNITTQDVTTKKSTTLSRSSSQGQTFNWAFGGALEVYSIAQCSDYPPNGSLTFSDLVLYTAAFKVIANPGWSVSNLSAGLTPQCNYGGKATGTQVTLTY